MSTLVATIPSAASVLTHRRGSCAVAELTPSPGGCEGREGSCEPGRRGCGSGDAMTQAGWVRHEVGSGAGSHSQQLPAPAPASALSAPCPGAHTVGPDTAAATRRASRPHTHERPSVSQALQVLSRGCCGYRNHRTRRHEQKCWPCWSDPDEGRGGRRTSRAEEQRAHGSARVQNIVDQQRPARRRERAFPQDTEPPTRACAGEQQAQLCLVSDALWLPLGLGSKAGGGETI